MGELVVNGNIIVTDQTTINPGVDGNEYHDAGQGLQLGAAYETPVFGQSGFFLGAGGGFQGFLFESNNPVNTQDFYPELSNDDASMLGAPANESGTCPNNSCHEEMSLNGVGLYAKGYAGYRPSFLQSRLSFQTGFELSQRWTPSGRAPIVYTDNNGDIAYYDGQSNIGGITGVNFNLGSSFDVTPALAVGAGFYTEMFGSTSYNNAGRTNTDDLSGHKFSNWGISLGVTFRPGKLGESFAPQAEEDPFDRDDAEEFMRKYNDGFVAANGAALDACGGAPTAPIVTQRDTYAGKTTNPISELEGAPAEASGWFYALSSNGTLATDGQYASYAMIESCLATVTTEVNMDQE